MKELKRVALFAIVVLASFKSYSQSIPGDSLVFGPMMSAVFNDSVRVWVLTKDGTGTGDVLTVEVTGAKEPNKVLVGTEYSSDSRLGYNIKIFQYGVLAKDETYMAVVKANGIVLPSKESSVINGQGSFGDFEFLAGGCGRIYDVLLTQVYPHTLLHHKYDHILLLKIQNHRKSLVH